MQADLQVQRAAVVDTNSSPVAALRVAKARLHVRPLCMPHVLFQKEESSPPSASGVVAEPNYLTIQLGFGVHIELFPEILRYTNHSCEPNSFFDTTLMHLVALRDISEGEEVCFFYPSSEWQMAQPFECNCGAASCLHLIEGAKNLAPDLISRYRFTDFILSQLHQLHRVDD